jgi:hypothetical protein
VRDRPQELGCIGCVTVGPVCAALLQALFWMLVRRARFHVAHAIASFVKKNCIYLSVLIEIRTINMHDYHYSTKKENKLK